MQERSRLGKNHIIRKNNGNLCGLRLVVNLKMLYHLQKQLLVLQNGIDIISNEFKEGKNGL